MTRKQLIIPAIIIILLFANCARYNKMVMLPTIKLDVDSVMVSSMHKNVSETRLKTNYKIHISFNGLEYSHLQSLSKSERVTNYNDISVFLQSYILDSEGFIEIPVIGKINLLDKTMSEAKELVQKQVNEFFKGVSVEIRLLSFEISVLGDVRYPGRHLFLNRKVTILDALAKSGGLSNHANVTNILLMRDKGDYKETVSVDLTSEELFSSEYFWLQPDDIIYIKPMKSKTLSVNSTAISIVLSGLTTLLLFLTYFAN